MGELIANVDASISITPPIGAVWTPSNSPNYTKIESSSAKCSGKNMLCTQIVLAIAGCTATGGFVGVGGGVITSTAVKVKAKAMGIKSAVMREKDTGTCSGLLYNVTTGVTMSCSCSLKIDSAGQSKTKAV